MPDSSGTRPLLPRGMLIIVGIAAALMAAVGQPEEHSRMRWRQCSWESSVDHCSRRRLPARHGLAGWVGTMRSLVAVFGIVALLFVLVVSGSSWPELEEYAPHTALSCGNRSRAARRLTN